MGEIFAKLGINGKLLLFQIANFLLLLFLLKKLLYRPMIDFLDKRQKKIEDGLKKAEEFEKEWQSIQELKKKEMFSAEEKATQIIEASRKEAEKKEKEILDFAVQKTEKIAREAKEDIRKEKEKMIEAAKSEMSEYIVLAAEKVLERTIGEKDEKKIAEEVMRKMKNE